MATLEWTVNAYALTFAAGIVSAAALGDRLGRRRVFVAGLGLFTAASAACALARRPEVLLAARAVQGLGAAGVMPLSLTILTAAFPPERRGAVVGIWGAISGLAVASGPVIGGAITQGIDWHWIFWVNVPVGVAAVALAAPEDIGKAAGTNSTLQRFRGAFGIAVGAPKWWPSMWARRRSSRAEIDYGPPTASEWAAWTPPRMWSGRCCARVGPCSPISTSIRARRSACSCAAISP